jgi:predicted Na+-dependent transporter
MHLPCALHKTSTPWLLLGFIFCCVHNHRGHNASSGTAAATGNVAADVSSRWQCSCLTFHLMPQLLLLLLGMCIC